MLWKKREELRDKVSVACTVRAQNEKKKKEYRLREKKNQAKVSIEPK